MDLQTSLDKVPSLTFEYSMEKLSTTSASSAVAIDMHTEDGNETDEQRKFRMLMHHC